MSPCEETKGKWLLLSSFVVFSPSPGMLVVISCQLRGHFPSVVPVIFFPGWLYPAMEMSVYEQEEQLHTTEFSAPGGSISKVRCIEIRRTLKKGVVWQ